MISSRERKEKRKTCKEVNHYSLIIFATKLRGLCVIIKECTNKTHNNISIHQNNLIMKKLVPLLIIILLSISSFSQNFRCINSNTTHYFEDAESAIKAIRIDSVVIEGENQTYYIYPTFARTDEWNCYTQYGPSWIGRKMTEVINGDNVFYNMEDEPITINTLSDLGDEWICYEFASGDYITASLSEIQSMEFLGITDMVKKITFQAKDANGSSISHAVNNMFLLLSENHGLIRTVNFRVFPDLYDDVWYEECHQYELRGIEGNEAGIQNLTKEGVFNFSVGDEYHTERYLGNWYMQSVNKELMAYTILMKQTSTENDTLFYQVSRCGKKATLENNELQFYEYNDTINVTYALNLYRFIDTLSKAVIVEENGSNHEYYYNIQHKLNTTEKALKWHWNGFYSEYPHDCIQIIITDSKDLGLAYNYFIEGLGGPYWDYDFYWEDYHKVLYYKTATEEWGEPLNCDSLMVNIEKPFIENQKVFFAPNPMTEKSTIKFKNINSVKCTLTIFNLYGEPVKIITHSNSEMIIKKESFAAGMYLYSLIIGNRVKHSGKLIVQ